MHVGGFGKRLYRDFVHDQVAACLISESGALSTPKMVWDVVDISYAILREGMARCNAVRDLIVKDIMDLRKKRVTWSLPRDASQNSILVLVPLHA